MARKDAAFRGVIVWRMDDSAGSDACVLFLSAWETGHMVHMVHTVHSALSP